MTDLGLTAYDAGLLTAEKPTADYFEECVTAISRNSDEDITRGIAKKAANWISGDFSRMLNTAGIGIRESQVTPWNLVELLVLVDRGDLSGPSAKAVFEEMFNTGKPAGKIVAEKGLVQIGDSSQIREAVLRALATNQAAVDDYHAGKEQALQFLTGQVMKLTRGRANPQMVREILIRELGGK
jgi:aspartyl-tRNA(Asn)/glutamyl-tRNA(Gln) amidotransferase subunit B